MKNNEEAVLKKEVEKMALPVISDNGEPIAIIFFNKNRDRIIYMLQKADEEEIVGLIES